MKLFHEGEFGPWELHGSEDHKLIKNLDLTTRVVAGGLIGMVNEKGVIPVISIGKPQVKRLIDTIKRKGIVTNEDKKILHRCLGKLFDCGYLKLVNDTVAIIEFEGQNEN